LSRIVKRIEEEKDAKTRFDPSLSEPAMLADLVILSDDLRRVDRLDELQIVRTVVGRCAFQNEEATCT
jgi:hypothetical protein